MSDHFTLTTHIIIILLLLREDISKLLTRIKHIQVLGADIDLNGKEKQ